MRTLDEHETPSSGNKTRRLTRAAIFALTLSKRKETWEIFAKKRGTVRLSSLQPVRRPFHLYATGPALANLHTSTIYVEDNAVLLSLKGWNNIAQGNALGHWDRANAALKGRNKRACGLLLRPFRADIIMASRFPQGVALG